MDRYIGKKLDGRYEIKEIIGVGGMANVYLANDTILERNVAIKVLRGDLSSDEKFIRRFKREALSVSNLSHPNIVEVYDVGEENEQHYIVMEYIEGETLKSYMAENDYVRASLKLARVRIAELEAEKIQPTENSAVFYLPDFTIPELIAFSNVANKSVGKLTVALSGADGDYKYVISSGSTDLRPLAKEINAALGGRGGGRAEMIQGSFSAGLDEIKDYFK